MMPGDETRGKPCDVMYIMEYQTLLKKKGCFGEGGLRVGHNLLPQDSWGKNLKGL